jgi:ubiquinone/menaquinone biosynthesis C-methylase UbiE
MKRDWDERARDDAVHFIATDVTSEDDFTASGERDAQMIMADVADLLPARTAAVEIGCGIGRLLHPMAARFDQVWGVDVSGEMVSQARTRLAALGNVHLVQTDGQTLAGIPSEHFDFCYSYIVFQHVPDRSVIVAYLREAHRVLRERGVLKCQVAGVHGQNPFRGLYGGAAADTWNGTRFTMPEIAEAVEDATFRMIAAYYHREDPQYLWVIARKASALQAWEMVYAGAARTLTECVRPGARVLLPEAEIAPHLVAAGAGHVTFVDVEPPDTRADAIERIERLRSDGAEYLLLTRSAWWWFDVYAGLADHLRTRYPLAAGRPECALFDLR